MLELPTYNHCLGIIQTPRAQNWAGISFQFVSGSSLPQQEEAGHGGFQNHGQKATDVASELGRIQIKISLAGS